jgi:hypothetical protein
MATTAAPLACDDDLASVLCMAVQRSASAVHKVKAFRFVCKAWKRSHRFIPTHVNDCRFVIDLMDFFEESRLLSEQEVSLRDEARAQLLHAVQKEATHWKQRGKFRAIREGGKNSKFFHAMASGRMRRNHIRVLDIDGVQIASHEAKAAALHDFYAQLLGLAREPS